MLTLLLPVSIPPAQIVKQAQGDELVDFLRLCISEYDKRNPAVNGDALTSYLFGDPKYRAWDLVPKVRANDHDQGAPVITPAPVETIGDLINKFIQKTYFDTLFLKYYATGKPDFFQLSRTTEPGRKAFNVLADTKQLIARLDGIGQGLSVSQVTEIWGQCLDKIDRACRDYPTTPENIAVKEHEVD